VIFLFIRLSPVTNSPLKAMFYRVISLYNVSHTFQHNFIRICKELARLDMSKVYDSTGQYMAFERRIYLAPSESRAVPGTHLHETFMHWILKLSSRAIRAINDCLIPIDNRGCLTRLYSSNDSINTSLFPRDILFSRIQLSGLLHQLILHIVALNYCW